MHKFSSKKFPDVEQCKDCLQAKDCTGQSRFQTGRSRILNVVNMTSVEFELLVRLKMAGNIEFHQDRVQTLDQAKKYLGTLPPELEVFKSHYKNFLMHWKFGCRWKKYFIFCWM